MILAVTTTYVESVNTATEARQLAPPPDFLPINHLIEIDRIIDLSVVQAQLRGHPFDKLLVILCIDLPPHFQVFPTNVSIPVVEVKAFVQGTLLLPGFLWLEMRLVLLP